MLKAKEKETRETFIKSRRLKITHNKTCIHACIQKTYRLFFNQRCSLRRNSTGQEQPIAGVGNGARLHLCDEKMHVHDME